MNAEFHDAASAATTLFNVAAAAANRRVSVDAVERGADGLPPSFGAVLVSSSVLLGLCYLRTGLADVTAMLAGIESELSANRRKTNESFARIHAELEANGRTQVEALRGIEDALRQHQRKPSKGMPCQRST